MSPPIPLNPAQAGGIYPPQQQSDIDDQRNGLSQRAAAAQNRVDANSAIAPAWLRFTQSLHAQGVMGPMHKDLFSRSRLRDEAKVSFEYFKAYSRERTFNPQNNSNWFLNNLPEFKKMLAACPNLRRSHVGMNHLFNLAGFRLIQLGDILNGLSGLSMNSLAIRNRHADSRNSLIFRWSRVAPALMVNALGAYVISRGITSLVKGSAFEGTVLDDYKGAYMGQVLTYGTGAFLRLASQLLAKGSAPEISPQGLGDIQSIFYSTITHMRSLHQLICLEDVSFGNLQSVFQEEFGRHDPTAQPRYEQLLSSFKNLAEVNLASLSELIADYIDMPVHDQIEVEKRAVYVTRLLHLASTDLRSERQPGDVSLRNQVEDFFHKLWATTYTDDSPSILHQVRQRPITPGDVPRALVAAGDKTEEFARTVAFSLDCIPGRYIREKLIEYDQLKPQPKIEPVAAHAVAMMLNVAAYGMLTVQIAKSSKQDGYNITPRLPSEDDFQASLSATSLLMMYMSFSATGLVLSTLGAGMEKVSQRLLATQANQAEQLHIDGNASHTTHRRVMRGNLESLFKAFTFIAIGSTLPLIQSNEGKTPTALLGVLSSVFLGLGMDQILRMKRGDV